MEVVPPPSSNTVVSRETACPVATKLTPRSVRGRERAKVMVMPTADVGANGMHAQRFLTRSGVTLIHFVTLKILKSH